MSLDSWSVLMRLDRGLSMAANRETSLGDAAALLDEMIVPLSAYSGLVMESMTRGPAWRFLDMGRRLERASAARQAEPEEDALLLLPLVAYPDRVCRRRATDPATGVMVGGRGVRLEPESVVREPEFFLALDPRDDRRGPTREARVRVASEVRLEWLEALFPESLRPERAVRFDASRGRAVAVTARWSARSRWR